MRHLAIWTLILCLTPAFARADRKTLFEAYYQILSHGQHVGYYIQRYELDKTKKEFISTYFLRTNDQGGNISESLKARATETLVPLGYQYTSLQAKEAKTIDANVRKDKFGKSILQIKLNQNGKLSVSEKTLEDGTFLSTFLIYLLLQSKQGLKPAAKYSFTAIAEEDGKPYAGEVFIESEVEKLGMNTFKSLYTFKRTQFVNFINSSGESLISVSPALGIEARLVVDPKLATQGMTFNEKSIQLLFGDIPKGNTHQLNSKAKGN